MKRSGLPDDVAREIQRRIDERNRSGGEGKWNPPKSRKRLAAEAAEVERENSPDRPLPVDRLGAWLRKSSPTRLSRKAADFLDRGCPNEAPLTELRSAEEAAVKWTDASENERLRISARAEAVRRDTENRSKGGRAPKYAKAIMAEASRFLKQARSLKAEEVFKLFPSSEHARTIILEDGEYVVYRDGKALVQVDPRGKEREVSIRSFIDRYISKARSRTK